MKIKNLFLVDGAAGSGKSDLIEFVRRQLQSKNTIIMSKYSTRAKGFTLYRFCYPPLPTKLSTQSKSGKRVPWSQFIQLSGLMPFIIKSVKMVRPVGRPTSFFLIGSGCQFNDFAHGAFVCKDY